LSAVVDTTANFLVMTASGDEGWVASALVMTADGD
jgi:hypothetical protein